MKFRANAVRIARGVVAAAGLLTALAQAATIPLVDTGVTASGTFLPLGAVDPSWTIVSGPGVTSPQPSYVLTNQKNPLGTYYSTTDSQWIWAAASGVAGVNKPYTFQLQFDLTGFDPATVSLSGAWGVDNTGSIELNGAAAIGTGLSLTNPSNFLAPNKFSITGGFVAGINTLDVVATDLGFVGGFDITALVATGTPVTTPPVTTPPVTTPPVTSAVPEPGSYLMLLAGLGLLSVVIRHRKASVASGIACAGR